MRSKRDPVTYVLTHAGYHEVITEEQIDEALTTVQDNINVQEIVLDSHTVALVTGLENADVIRAITIYVVACAAQVIQTDLSICAELLGHGANAMVRLQHDIEGLIGADNAGLDAHSRENVRDPWIVECLGHLFLSLSRKVAELSPPGTLLVLLPVHDDVKDHGIDLAGLHLETATALGMSIGEAKTSQLHAQRQISRANEIITEVEAAKRDMHLRRLVTMARPALTQAHRQLVVEAVWQDNRAYLPVVSYAEGSDFDPTAERPRSFGAHNLTANRVRLIALRITRYPEFFDSVADEIRACVANLRAR